MNDWKENDNKLEKLFTFNNFKEALAFANKVGEIAEKLQHHPNITLQNYKEVLIATTTHDADNTITDKDRELAQKIDQIS